MRHKTSEHAQYIALKFLQRAERLNETAPDIGHHINYVLNAAYDNDPQFQDTLFCTTQLVSQWLIHYAHKALQARRTTLAHNYLEALAALDDSDLYFKIGALYREHQLNGHAWEYFQKGAEQQHSGCQLELAKLYFKENSLRVGINFLAKAAQAHHAEAVQSYQHLSTNYLASPSQGRFETMLNIITTIYNVSLARSKHNSWLNIMR